MWHVCIQKIAYIARPVITVGWIFFENGQKQRYKLNQIVNTFFQFLDYHALLLYGIYANKPQQKHFLPFSFGGVSGVMTKRSL